MFLYRSIHFSIREIILHGITLRDNLTDKHFDIVTRGYLKNLLNFFHVSYFVLIAYLYISTVIYTSRVPTGVAV